MTAQPSLQTDILDDVRQGFATVAQMVGAVRLRLDKLPAYAETLLSVPPEKVFDSTHHFIGTPEETAAYTLILDSINFGSGYSPFLVEEGWQRIDNSIYFTVASRLKAYFEWEGVPSAEKLTGMTDADVADILGLDLSGSYSREFALLCREALEELGTFLLSGYGGDYLGFVNAAEGSAAKMAGLLSQLENFHDVHNYKGINVAFYKRAQITAADLHLAFGHIGQALFHDIDRLTMFADNAVPHVLRVDGILEYDPWLASKIDQGALIKSGSEEEVEMRACAGAAVEVLAKLKKMTAMEIDHILWHRSVESDRYKKLKPHRTLTVFY